MKLRWTSNSPKPVQVRVNRFGGAPDANVLPTYGTDISFPTPAPGFELEVSVQQFENKVVVLTREVKVKAL